MLRSDGVVSIGGNGCVQAGVHDDGTEHVPAKHSDEEPAYKAEPFLHEYPVVEDERDTGEGARSCIAEVECVVDLSSVMRNVIFFE